MILAVLARILPSSIVNPQATKEILFMRKYGSNRFGILACSLAVSAMVASGCGADGALGMQDWQRDLLGLIGLPPIIPILVPGGTGAPGPAGAPGAPGAP